MAPPKRSELYELESLLYTIGEDGYVVVSRARLLRLLGKGNEAKGTWDALIDAWEGIGQNADDLLLARLPGPKFLLTVNELTKVKT